MVTGDQRFPEEVPHFFIGLLTTFGQSIVLIRK